MLFRSFEHIRKEAGAVILRITYGYTPNAKGPDPLVDVAGQAMAEFADASVPGKWPVDVMPFSKLASVSSGYHVCINAR